MAELSQANLTLIIIVCMIALLLTNRFTIGTVSLLGALSLYFAGVIEAKEVYRGFSNSVVINVAGLVIASYVISKAGILDRATSLIIKLAGGSEKKFFILILALLAAITPFINKNIVYFLIFPMVIYQANSMCFDTKKLMLPMTAVFLVANPMMATSTASNIWLTTKLPSIGLPAMSYFEVTPLVLILVVISIAYYYFIGRKLIPSGCAEVPYEPDEHEQPPKWKRGLILLIFAGYLASVISGALSIEAGVLLMVSFYAILGLVSVKDAYQKLPIDTLVMLGFTQAFAVGIQKSGLAAESVKVLTGFLGTEPPQFLFIIVILAIASFLTLPLNAFTALTIMFPIVVSACKAFGFSPLGLIYAISVCTLAFDIFLPFNAYSSTTLQCGDYRITDFIKAGLPLFLLLFIVTALLVPIFWPL